MATDTLRSRGQITVPRAIRERLGLRTGIRFDEEGQVVLRPTGSSVAGMVSGILDLAKEKPASVEEDFRL